MRRDALRDGRTHLSVSRQVNLVHAKYNYKLLTPTTCINARHAVTVKISLLKHTHMHTLAHTGSMFQNIFYLQAKTMISINRLICEKPLKVVFLHITLKLRKQFKETHSLETLEGILGNLETYLGDTVIQRLIRRHGNCSHSFPP